MNLMANIARLRAIRSTSRRRRGVAAVEFALTLPVWITLFLGMADGGYCLLVNEKCDRIAYSVTDIVTQYSSITKANLNDIILAAGQLMQPFPFSANGVVVVTSVYQPAGGTPTIMWQYTGGGTASYGSQIGTAVGGNASLPNGLTLNDNDNVIISEVFYTFTPMFVSSGIIPNRIYRTAVYKPRLSPLITPPT